MGIQCPNCKTLYEMSDFKISDKGSEVICPKCQTRFNIVPDFKTTKDTYADFYALHPSNRKVGLKTKGRVRLLGWLQLSASGVIFFFLLMSAIQGLLNIFTILLSACAIGLNFFAGYLSIKRKVLGYWLSILNQSLQTLSFAVGSFIYSYSGIGGVWVGFLWNGESWEVILNASIDPGFALFWGGYVQKSYVIIDILAIFFVGVLLSALSAHAQEKLRNELPSKIVKLYQQGRYAEAAKVAEEALTDAEKIFGPNHPNLATSLDYLAAQYRIQGKYAEAEPLYKLALKILERAHGPEHIKVAIVCENLGKLYSQIGKEDEAQKLEARARKIRSK